MSNSNPKTPNNLDRRRFLITGGLAAAAFALGGASTGLRASGESRRVPIPQFTVQPLEYPVDSLEPHIDATTMEIHHGRHYTGYVNRLNAALEQAQVRGPASLPKLLGDLQAIPETVRTAVRNNGGGAYNHEIFWRVLSPDGGGDPPGELARAIDRDFGSIAAFRSAFSAAAGGVFGSGWAWVCTDRDGSLFITSTPNQDSPVMHGAVERTGTPICGLDVWEHAYYLHYQNRRSDYIAAFWNLVDWGNIAQFYRDATAE